MPDYTSIIDGNDILEERARISGEFPVDHRDAKKFSSGEQIVLVTVIQVKPPSFKTVKDEYVRVNAGKVLEGHVIRSPEFARQILERMEFDYLPDLEEDDTESDAVPILSLPFPPHPEPIVIPAGPVTVVQPHIELAEDQLPEDDEDLDEDALYAEWLEYEAERPPQPINPVFLRPEANE